MCKKWIRDCKDYWETRISEMDLGCDFIDALEMCWRCGCKRKLQKCHIIPKALGGSDTSDNLIPLCADCHDEAPDCLDDSEVWDWIRSDHATTYATFWLKKALEKSKVQFLEKHIHDKNKLKSVTQNVFKKMNSHWRQSTGGNRYKISTLSWGFKKMLQSLEVNNV